MKTQKQIFEPFHLDMHGVFLETIKELGSPYPSVKPNGWGIFNQLTGGFRPREFTILCGSTGSGKTTWLANLSAELIMNDVKHFVMSVETGHTDFMKRIMSAWVADDLNTGEVVSAQKIATISARYLQHIEKNLVEFSLYDNRVAVEQLCFDLESMAKKGCKIAMIDNLNFFMEVTKSSDTILEMDRVIHELIILCKRIDMHVIMVMHPKKTDGGRVESEFDVKGSSTAVQEAHNVFLFNRPSKEMLKAGTRIHTQRELKLAKMRRRGLYVGKSIIYDSQNTQYQEKGLA